MEALQDADRVDRHGLHPGVRLVRDAGGPPRPLRLRRVLARIVVPSAFTALTGAATGFWPCCWSSSLPFRRRRAGPFQPCLVVVLDLGSARPVRPSRPNWWLSPWSRNGGRLIESCWARTFVVFGSVGVFWAAAFLYWFRDEPAAHPAVNAAELHLIASGLGPGVARPRRPLPLATGPDQPQYLAPGLITNSRGVQRILPYFTWYRRTSRRAGEQQQADASQRARFWGTSSRAGRRRMGARRKRPSAPFLLWS